MCSWVLYTTFLTDRWNYSLKVFELHYAPLIHSGFVFIDHDTVVYDVLFCRNSQMELTLLSNPRHHNVNAAVRFRVIRKWDFRGLSDNGLVQHVDMVLVDEKVCFFLCSTTPPHKLIPWKPTVLIPLCYIFSTPIMLYRIMSPILSVLHSVSLWHTMTTQYGAAHLLSSIDPASIVLLTYA
jgi:hypothetical protein